MLKIYIISLIIAAAVSFPAKEVYDKATFNDIALNDVNSDKKQINSDFPIKETTATSGIDIIIETSSPSTTTSTLPHRPGSAFARIIDDIFQIPITVLQSVSRLLTNPFIGGNKTPENASGY